MALDDLYQEVLLDHYKRPRNKGRLPNAELQVALNNPLCGDEIILTVCFNGDRISDMAFDGHGCVISQASASLMTEKMKGLTIAEAEQIIDRFGRMLKTTRDDRDGSETAQPSGDIKIGGELDELNAFKNVCDYPSRVKCAMLAWRSLAQALERRRSGASA